VTPTRSTAELIAACGKADRSAWDVIVERYTPLMWSIARAHRLSLADCEDVVQTTWLQIVHHLDKVHTPERLGEWIGTATRREALKHIQTQKKHVPVGDGATLDRPERLDSSPEEAILDRERDSEVLSAFCQLSPHCQELLSLLMRDPAPSYDEISVILTIPRGSIGPTRSRCLARLERLMSNLSHGCVPSPRVADEVGERAARI